MNIYPPQSLNMIHDRYKHFGAYGGKEPRQKLMKDSDTALYVPNLKENDSEISIAKLLEEGNISLKSCNLKTNKNGEKYFILDFATVSIKDSAIQRLQDEGYTARAAWEKQKDDANLYCEFPKEYTEEVVNRFFTQHLQKTESKGRISSIKMLQPHAQIQPCMVRFSDADTAQAVLKSAKKESNFEINFALKTPQKNFNRYGHADSNGSVHDRVRQPLNGNSHNYASYIAGHRPLGIVRNNMAYLTPIQHQYQQPPNILYPNGAVQKALQNTEPNSSPMSNVSTNSAANGVTYPTSTLAQNNVHIAQSLPPGILTHANNVAGLPGMSGSPYNLPHQPLNSQLQQMSQINHKLPANPVGSMHPMLQPHVAQNQQPQPIHNYAQNTMPGSLHHPQQSAQSVLPILIQPQLQNSYPNTNPSGYSTSAPNTQIQFPNTMVPVDQLTCHMSTMNLNGHFMQPSFAPVPLHNGQFAYAAHPNQQQAYFIPAGLESYPYLSHVNNVQCNPVSTSSTPTAAVPLQNSNGQQGILQEPISHLDQGIQPLQASASS